jgi:hypothetical protein
LKKCAKRKAHGLKLEERGLNLVLGGSHFFMRTIDSSFGASSKNHPIFFKFPILKIAPNFKIWKKNLIRQFLGSACLIEF